MQIEIWSLGKKSEAHIEEGIKFYLQRIKPYCSVKIETLAPPKRTGTMQPEQSKLLEENIILERLQAHHFLILLDERGKQLNSLQWSNQFQELMNRGTKTIVFLIGGPWGVSEKVKTKANKIWSLSTLTFPHQLVRLLITEQIYRAFSILNNSPYHHE